jgi:hypothetical protein
MIDVILSACLRAQGILQLLHDLSRKDSPSFVNPLNAELSPICHLLTLLGAHHNLRVSRIKVNGNNLNCTVASTVIIV